MKTINPIEAYALMQDNSSAVLVDVRSTIEYEYVGHPVQALHVPIQEPPGWETRADFIDLLRQALKVRFGEDARPEDLTLLILCRSGKRSALAASLALDNGFVDVYNILEGFEGDQDGAGHRNTISGWRFHQLPWEQS